MCVYTQVGGRYQLNLICAVPARPQSTAHNAHSSPKQSQRSSFSHPLSNSSMHLLLLHICLPFCPILCCCLLPPLSAGHWAHSRAECCLLSCEMAGLRDYNGSGAGIKCTAAQEQRSRDSIWDSLDIKGEKGARTRQIPQRSAELPGRTCNSHPSIPESSQPQRILAVPIHAPVHP